MISQFRIHYQNENSFYFAQVVELHNMMSCNEATLGPDGRVAMVNGEGTTDLAIITSSGGNNSVSAKKPTSSNSKYGSSKGNHVCTICKYIHVVLPKKYYCLVSISKILIYSCFQISGKHCLSS